MRDNAVSITHEVLLRYVTASEKNKSLRSKELGELLFFSLAPDQDGPESISNRFDADSDPQQKSPSEEGLFCVLLFYLSNDTATPSRNVKKKKLLLEIRPLLIEAHDRGWR
jgi:hypothetical protein